jgi:hypothetical protein
MTARAADWIGLAFVVALVYVLVRPGSKAGQFVDAFTSFLVALVKGATGLADGDRGA